MIPFDYDKWKVENRQVGVRIGGLFFPVVGLTEIQYDNGILLMGFCEQDRSAHLWLEDGQPYSPGAGGLLMPAVKKSYWVNLYKHGASAPYPTEKDAKGFINSLEEYLKTIEVSWED